ncbi:MAG: 23S rRNA (guanosine(2251)-2'-O)-methyltransferase RlmB [Myxococcales bacterium]|nr:23S rRNA (guanosine(2251)-2'-O)-methyltransferase RlmB [Myxococcales bacterium]
MDEPIKRDAPFVIWGRNPVIEALQSGQPLEKVLIAHDSHPPRALLALVDEQRVKLQKVPRQKIESLAGTKKTQGVIALCSPIHYAEFDELVAEVVAKKGVLLVLDHITDPQNVGGLIRTAEVLGLDGVVTPRERSCPLNEVVVKTSAGALFHIPVAKVGNLRQALKTFQERGGWVAVIEKGGTPLTRIDPPFPLAIVVGSEGKGTSKMIVEMADVVASISMRGRVTSLNVAAAAAIGLHHIVECRYAAETTP